MKKFTKQICLCIWMLLAVCLLTGIPDHSVLNVEAKASSYSIHYQANGGKGKMAAQNCSADRKVRLQKNKFKKKGYSFTGWNTKKNGSGKVYANRASVKNLTSKSSVTLYAQWGKNYKVSFHANGGTSAVTSKTVVSGQKYGTLPVPEKNGYDFKGWYTKKKGGKKITASSKVKLKKKQTLYARWKLATYTITYDLDGGSNASSNPASYKFTTETFTLADPVRNGYRFTGWHLNSRYGAVISTIPKGSFGNLSLYARWTPITYSITYHLDGGRNSYSNPKTYTVETSKRFCNPSKTGYHFDGWFLDSGFTAPVSSLQKGTTGNLDLYAKWTLETYTITYELNGGTVTGDNPSSYTYLSGPYTFADAQKRGYEFNGWRVNSSDGYLIDGFSAGSYHENLILYADFEAIRYSVSYELDSGTNHANNPDSYTIENNAYTLRAPSRDGYAFRGWFTDEACTDSVTKIATDGCEDLTFYASWEKIPVTRLTYIRDLCNALNLDPDSITLPVDEDGNICYHFDDVAGLPEEDAQLIEAAVVFGILETEPDETKADFFDPEAAATRDFAAYTTVHALGFMTAEDDKLAVPDYPDASHPLEDGLAVKQQLLTLKDSGNFDPDAFLTTEEETSILEKATSIAASVPETLETKNDITYVESLQKINTASYTVTEDTDGDGSYTITVTDGSAASLQSGDTVLFEANEEHPGGLAVKILSVSTTGNTTTLTACSPEDISDLLSDVDISGYGTIENPKLAEIDTPNGIEASYDPNGVIENPDSAATLSDMSLAFNPDVSGSVAVPGTINFKFDNTKLTDKTTVNGTLKVSIPSIAYRLNMDIGIGKLKINDLYLAVTRQASVVTDITTTLSGGGIADDGAIEIGRLPMPLGPSGFSIDLVFWFNYSISGKAQITYTLQTTEGIQYINGSLRSVKDGSSSVSAEAYGALEVGPKLSLMLTFGEIFDLVDITGDVGVGVKADVNLRDTGLTCADLGTYVYLTVSAGDNSLIGDLLDLNYTWYIWGNSDSPFRKNFHMEGQNIDFSSWKTVPECTYGDGDINGTVVMADSRTPIPAASVCIFKTNGGLFKTLYSDSDGNFSGKLPQGSYSVMTFARGFLPHLGSFQITNGSNIFLDTVMMSDSVTADTVSTISGEILDSISGDPVDHASITVYNGYNSSSGTALASSSTDSNGCYNLDLICGNYTLKFSKSGYIDTVMNVTVTEQPSRNINGEMTRLVTGDPEGMLRIVLTWGKTPRDLDSHLIGPKTNGNGIFHVYYSNRNYYSNGKQIVNLDRDDTDSYGPETTAVYELNPTGTYSFYVHDYTNGSGDSTELSLSGAQVKVYYSGSLMQVFHVPYNQPATMWHVFDFDAASKTITPKNIMTPDHYSDLTAAESDAAEDTSYLDRLVNDIDKHRK